MFNLYEGSLLNLTFSDNLIIYCVFNVRLKYQEWQRPQDVRWSPRLKQCKEDLDNTDNCRFILLLVEDIRQQLLHGLLPGEEDRHEDEEKAGFRVICPISSAVCFQ